MENPPQQTPFEFDPGGGRHREPPAAEDCRGRERGVYAATDMLLPAELAGQLASLAEITYPFEACGLLVGQQIGCTVVVEQITYGRNLESTSFQGRVRPQGYRLDPEDFVATDIAARNANRDIVGVWHSHPDTPALPQMRGRPLRQVEGTWAGYSYLIVSISALGSAELRSWRFTQDRFLEERLR